MSTISSTSSSTENLDASAITGTNTSEGFDMNAELEAQGIKSTNQDSTSAAASTDLSSEEKMAAMDAKLAADAEDAEYQELEAQHNGEEWSLFDYVATVLTGGVYGVVKAGKDDANSEVRYRKETARREDLMNSKGDTSQLSTTAVATTESNAKVGDASSITGTNEATA